MILTMLIGMALATIDSAVVRVNQVGYLPEAPKIAVACSIDDTDSAPRRFRVLTEIGAVVLGPRVARRSGGFGPCKATWRLDFSAVRSPGRYVLEFSGAPAASVRIGRDVYAGGADTALHYMREQRSGFNPFFRDSVHRLDGNVIDDSGRVVKFQPASGGW